MFELRWVRKQGAPSSWWIPLGDYYPPLWQVLEYRHQVNVLELGIQEPIWSDWLEVQGVAHDPHNAKG